MVNILYGANDLFLKKIKKLRKSGVICEAFFVVDVPKLVKHVYVFGYY